MGVRENRESKMILKLETQDTRRMELLPSTRMEKALGGGGIDQEFRFGHTELKMSTGHPMWNKQMGT